MKMAYASLPKLVPLSTANMCPNNAARSTLSEVLQSDPVRRLLNQPNIIIKAMPLTRTGDTSSKRNVFGTNGNGISLENVRPPEVSIVPVGPTDEDREDANLLPSKIEDKKSEITMLPLKRKACGHYEPCESIVCDVVVQQYVERDRMSPMLAVSIEEDEINAPVAKHCENAYCDALSIDHNRCRRALIRLHRCDESRVCDICGIVLRGWRSRVHHRNCKRKDEYRHNNVNRADLLKERMRERELQILEAARAKKNDYLDPVNGHNLAMENLRKNEELIIIPKAAPSQKPIITITSIPNTQSIGANPSKSVTQPVNVNTQVNDFRNIAGNVPFVLSSQNHNATRPSNASRLEESRAQPMNRVRFPSLQRNSYGVTSSPVSVPPLVAAQNQYVHLATGVQPITINNWVVSSPHVLTTAPIQPKSSQFLTPIRVVPITNLITAPSLLHRTQGIPKFCIMTDNVMAPLAVPNPPPSLQPTAAPAAPDVAARQEQRDVSNAKVPIQPSAQHRPKKAKKKFYLCNYCLKHFSTDWYFKLHVAKHNGEKLFSCSDCDESFSNKYELKRHVTKKHKNREECDYARKSPIKNRAHQGRAASGPDGDASKRRSEERKKVKRESECSVNDANDRATSVCNSNGVDADKLKGENTLDGRKDNEEISISWIKTELQDDNVTLENTRAENHDSEESLAISGDDNAKTNEFTFVSVGENIDSEKFVQEAVIA